MKTLYSKTLSLALLLAFGACAPTQTTRAVEHATPPRVDLEELADRTVLLVSHPSPLIVGTLHALVERGLLAAPKLLVIGLHHMQERESYAASRAYLRKKKIDWMRLHQLDCRIDASSVFEKNACSPAFERLMRHSAGVIFFGGADIPPKLYGEETLLTTEIRTPYRQYWEISFLAHLLGTSRNAALEPLMKARPAYRVLAICMGLQALNVATGGTLIQDIPSEVYGAKTFEQILKMPAATHHRSAARALRPHASPEPGVYHPIRFSAARDFWKALYPHAQELSVLSAHHQAVEKVGAGLKVIATSLDGKIVEAMKHERFPNVLALQFHPEYYIRDRHVSATEKKPFRLAPLVEGAHLADFHRRFWRYFTGLLLQR